MKLTLMATDPGTGYTLVEVSELPDAMPAADGTVVYPAQRSLGALRLPPEWVRAVRTALDVLAPALRVEVVWSGPAAPEPAPADPVTQRLAKFVMRLL